MKIFTENITFSRRQFLKGSGMLAASAIVFGIFHKLGIDAVRASDDYIEKRITGLYSLDEQMTIRRSHKNPEIIKIYEDFLSPGKVNPLSEKSHHLLHTKYGKDTKELTEELKSNSHHTA